MVTVFGDAFAMAVVRGLTDPDAGDPVSGVVDRTADDAGLVAVEPAVWVRAIEAARIQAGRMDAAVVLVGGNDDLPLRNASGEREPPGSAAWRQLYGERVDQVATAFRDKHIPLIWVGLPIVRDADDARLYAAVNELVRDRAVRDGATFIDSWQAFADENGDFSTTGPDVTGRPATLRWTNGWNFTRAGARKLASFVTTDVRRLRDRLRATEELAVVPNANPDDFDQALSIDVNAQIRREAGLPVEPRADAALPAGLGPEAGPVLALTAPPLAPDGALAPPIPFAAPGTLFDPLRSPVPHPGRADDFTWPRP